MNRRPLVVALSAGLALTVACRSASKVPDPEPGPTSQGPGDEQPVPDAHGGPTVLVVDERLPTWDSVRSSHPEGATNPPRPVLIVDPKSGACFKDWEPGMIAPQPHTDDRVQACPEPAACGTQIQCPRERALELLTAAASRK